MPGTEFCSVDTIPEVFEDIQKEHPNDGPEYIASLLVDRLEPEIQKKLEPKPHDEDLMKAVLFFKHELHTVLEDEDLDQDSPNYFLIENIYGGLDGLARIVINDSVSIPTELNRLLTYDQSDWTPRQMGKLVKEIIQSRLGFYDEKPSDKKVAERMEKTIPMVLKSARELKAKNYEKIAEIGKNITKQMRRKALDELSALDQKMGLWK